MVAYIDDLLEARTFDDYGPNGLQVTGSDQVDRIVTGVSAHLELFERARDLGAQLVLCHHGIIWGALDSGVTPQMRRRLEVLFDADMSLVAHHLPLDAHPEVGNNALLCELIGMERGEPFGEAKGRQIGFVAHSDEGIAPAELVSRLGKGLGSEPLVFDAGPDLVHNAGIVTGSGSFAIHEAAARGLDALITGEPTEHVMADAQEAGIHFMAAGHYATETLGVRRLGELVAERFDLEHTFIEVPNPI